MIGRFFKGFWELITGIKNAMGNIIFLILLAIITISIVQSDTIIVPETAALIINPMGIIVEEKQMVDPFAEFLSDYESEETETRLKDILDAIDDAKSDSRIKLLVLDLHKFQGAGFSKLEEIGDALEEFKHSGKPIYAFGKSYTQSQYYLASHATNIYLDENSHQLLGGVFLTGLSVYPTFYKSALEKLNINYHIYKAGQYKSAVEPYIRDDMSPEAKLATSAWLDQLWDKYTNTIIQGRNISKENFVAYTNQYDELLANANDDPNILAVQQKLVDDLISKTEWVNILKDIVGGEANSYNHISLNNYVAANQDPMSSITPGGAKIAVITAAGAIYDGERPAGEVGSKSMSKLIREAREDHSIKALVVRIDSPGGSASASEDIRQELLLTKEAGKPVIVSMSSYAASGGYWIAANANKIFAQATTITGSIGTFVSFPTLERTAADYGIYTDGVGTTKLSGSMSLLKDVSPILDRSLRRSVNFTYNKFVNIVAEGRSLSFEEVDDIAQGRVWTANDGLRNGLIDALGSLDDAIESAALLADISDYEVLHLEKQLSPKEVLLKEILNSSLKVVYENTGGLGLTRYSNLVSKEFQHIVEMSQSPGIYSQCFVCKITQ